MASQAQSSTIISSRDQAPSTHGFLLDVARYFRNRALQVWGGVSVFNGVPLVLQSINSIEGISNDDYQGDDILFPTDIPVTAAKNQPDVIDPLSYRVPCPRTSGGILSTLGYISCFGGSRLLLKLIGGKEDLDRSASFTPESVNQDIKVNTDDPSFTSTPTFLQQLNPTRHSTDQEPDLQLNVPDSKTSLQTRSNIMYPKTYGDLLVFQRDSKINNQAKTKQREEILDSESLKPETKTQAPIKTTERYYEYFIHMQGRQGKVSQYCLYCML